MYVVVSFYGMFWYVSLFAVLVKGSGAYTAVRISWEHFMCRRFILRIYGFVFHCYIKCTIINFVSYFLGLDIAGLVEYIFVFEFLI